MYHSNPKSYCLRTFERFSTILVPNGGLHVITSYFSTYLQERRELLDCYREENYKTQSIIEDYATGYRKLIGELLEYPDDIAAIKGCIKEMVTNYTWVFELSHRELFYFLMGKDRVLAIMCLLMVDECRQYYLPIESEDENGKLVLDISSNADKKAMYNSLCQLVRSGDVEKALADNLHSFAGITDGYWKDLEPEGKKYMIISMAEGDYVRSAGNRNEEFSSSDVKERFLIVNGVDYKSNYSSHTLLYVEV